MEHDELETSTLGFWVVRKSIVQSWVLGLSCCCLLSLTCQCQWPERETERVRTMGDATLDHVCSVSLAMIYSDTIDELKLFKISNINMHFSRLQRFVLPSETSSRARE